MKQNLVARNNIDDNDNLAYSVGMEAVVAVTLLLTVILCSVLMSGYTSAFGIQPVLAASPLTVVSITTPPPSDVKIDIASAHKVNGIAGQFIKIEGIITNLSHNETINGGIAYISVVDIKNKVPIDLEDWSAAKGLYIPVIEAGQSLPLEWNLRLVKAGSYAIDLLFNKDGDFASPPSASSKVFLEVAPKLNLNPGNVLPVAFGVPALIMGVLGVVNYIRGRKTGIYG
ncbi:MAG: hypothetical protein M3044_00525 [Thermoproteota archaeon]|nr:hypothetical protein [Thermoproteota archaeon]